MRARSRRLIQLSVILGLVAAAARPADACTCGGWSKCGDLASADAVFEATIASIENNSGIVRTPNAPSATFINGGGMRAVSLKDVRGWRGETPSVIFTGQGGGDCGFDFVAGQRYLIQASRSSDGQFTTGICSLIREIRYAAPLIEYLKALKESPAQTRVMGTVARVTGWSGYENAMTPLGGAQVTLKGPKQITLSTDTDGRFVTTGLPQGMYDVSVRVDGKAVAPDDHWSKFLLGRDGMMCEELAIAVPATGAAKGRVVDEDGALMKNVFIYILSADHVDRYGSRPGWGLTLPDGEFLVEELPPGRYLLAKNPGLGPMPGEPYLETQTVPFEVVSDKVATAPTLRLIRATTVVVSGIVRDAQGAPIAGAPVDHWIQLSNGRRSTSWPHVKTGADGRFELKLWKDQRYIITVGPEREPWGQLEFVADGRPIAIAATPR